MVASLVASLALLAGAASVSASSVGDSVVVNSCDYTVYVQNTPAAGGGQVAEKYTLSPGQSWSHQWTALTNGAGWSIKIAKEDTDEAWNTDTMQYEYTLQPNTIWWDLSCVNGCPWQGIWNVESNQAACITKDQAYRYSEDDAHGMQTTCDPDSVITLTICSNNNGTSSDGSGSSDASPSASSTAAAVPAPSSSSQSAAGWPLLSIGGIGNVLQAAEHVPTTLATISSAPAPAEPAITDAPAADDNIVTHVDVAYVTEVVTAFANSRVKRHQHHAHGHQHQA